MKKYFTILIFLNLVSFEGQGQTGYGYFDAVEWSKIDTIQFDSHFSLIVFEKDSIQEIRVDHIGNSSSTIVFNLIGKQLSTVVVVTDDPGREPRERTERYKFSNGELMAWSVRNEFEMDRTNSNSTNFENEENQILQQFAHYIKMVREYYTAAD
jgi:hypothetical protein